MCGSLKSKFLKVKFSFVTKKKEEKEIVKKMFDSPI